MESKGSGLMGKSILAGVLLFLGGAHQFWKQYYGGVVPASWMSWAPQQEQEDFALFTHEKGDLHCMERELRHPCVKELRNFIDNRDNSEMRSVALDCVNDVRQWSTDYWELRNMTHLLLDLDTVVHVFDKESRHNDFVLAGIRFAEKLFDHPECIAEFDTKNHMQTRCVPLYGKIVILKYKNAGMHDDARRVYDKLKAMSFDGKVNKFAAGEAVKWDHYQHTPQIWVPGLYSNPVWPEEKWPELPIVKALEDNFKIIKEESMKAAENPEEVGFEDAYRFLYEKGSWDTLMLYHNRTFTEECETVFPKTCAMLKTQLPSKPGLPWTSNQNEQAMVIKMTEGTDVETHSGPANNILNIHIGIAGLEGARLSIANDTYKWNEGKVIAWDGSYDHAVDCINCKQERVIMMVRYMHPDTAPHHFKGIKKTHYEEVPLHMQ